MNSPGATAPHTCRKTSEGVAWLQRLPEAVGDLEPRWSLTLGTPFDGEVSCSWVAPVTRADGTPAVLKLSLPHLKSERETDRLRFWDGNPEIQRCSVSQPTPGACAMLLERCEPGTVLLARPEMEQDLAMAGLLRRLWRPPLASGRDAGTLERRDACSG